MDVICQLRDGRRIVVEMQQEKRTSFKDRIAYYGAANFVKQLHRGDKYTEVRAVYVICFVNFKMQHEDCPPGKIIYTYELREQETGELYGEYISLNFCELPRLRADSFEELSPKEEWFQLLKKMRTFALNPKGVPERMRKVLEASRTNGLPDKELQQYFRAMVTDTEREDIATANYHDGFDAGMEKGVEKGMEKGVAIGKEDGRMEERIQNARNLKALGVPVSTIAQALNLSEEQVRALK